jgi:formamidopyrimidine-DNA glycosylase
MPELPEVETIRTGLKEKILGKKITDIKLNLRKQIKTDFKEFISIVKGNSIADIERIGKFLAFKLGRGNKYILAHLRMTGQLIYRKGKVMVAGGHQISEKDLYLPNKYSHVVFTFSDGSNLFFNDQRQFGYMMLAGKNEVLRIRSGYGVEPLSKEFTLAVFKKIIFGRSTNIKAMLLDQKKIAGIGNIYADESLFAAHIYPGRPANSLNETEIKNLHSAIIKILRSSIKHGGTTFSNFLDCEGTKGRFIKFLKIYGRKGQRCFRCPKSIVQKTKIAGRGTSYCEKCQK